MKHVLVHAYLANNLGDDLFVRVLCDRYPHVTFHVYAHDSYKLRFQDIANCQVHSPGDADVEKENKRMSYFKVENGYFKKLIRQCDAVVHIGGSVFVQHYDDWSDFYKTDAQLAKKSKRIYVIGANFGPFSDESYYTAYKKLFQGYAGICFRDRYSKKMFPDMDNISYAPDVLWGLQVDPLKEKKKKVIFAPIELGHRTGKYDLSGYLKEYMEFQIKMVKSCIAKGYEVSLAAFCPFQKDDVVVNEIYESLTDSEKEKVTGHIYTFDTGTLIKEFEEAEAVVGTRFHSAVLGMLCGCRVLPLIYDQKTRKTLEDMEYPWYLELEEMKGVKPDECIEKLLQTEVYQTEALVQGADKQFVYLDRLLKR